MLNTSLRAVARTEDSPVYLATTTTPDLTDTEADNLVIAEALRILEARITKPGATLSNPQMVKDYLQLHLGALEHEAFAVLFLNAQHGLIECRRMFNGTLTQTSVYPREVVKAALEVNAGAVILAHNHPSGSTDPSRADEFLTQTLKSALALIDVRVLDHLIVGAGNCTSFAERGLI